MTHQIGMFKAEQLNPQPLGRNEWLVLSLTEPWATALFVPGVKRIETRGWRTNYRGTLYIHASKAFPGYAREFAMEEKARGRLPASPLPLGCIIGSVRLLDVKSTRELATTISPVEALYGDYGPGRWGWITADPQLLPEPIPAKGQLGLWTFTPDGASTHA